MANSAKMNVLKPCWGCGGTNIRLLKGIKHTQGHTVPEYIYCCRDCGMYTPGNDTVEEAATAWNVTRELLKGVR